MNIEYSIAKGILQGLTEFLPVSSTSHLIFMDAFAKMFGWHTTSAFIGEAEFFDIMLHLGTLLAVVVYFRQELCLVWQSIFNPASVPQKSIGEEPIDLKRLPFLLAVSMGCTVVLVLLFLKHSDFLLSQPHLVGLNLVITGFLLFLTERFSRARQGVVAPVTLKHAAVIGIFQGCAAIFHGLSRSGTTISGGLITGLNRVTATRYSFLLSIPTFLMAALYEGYKLVKVGGISHVDWLSMLAGVVCSAVVGYFCVKYFIQYVARHTLTGFAIYCWIVGLSMFVFFGYIHPIKL